VGDDPRPEGEPPPGSSHVYLITVDDGDDPRRPGFDDPPRYRFAARGRRLAVGDVLRAGEEGWPGPTVAVEEIDRHPDGNGAGIALAHAAVARPLVPR